MWILWLIAVLCVIYYVIIVTYSGLSTSFSIIWLFFCGGLYFIRFRLGYLYKTKRQDSLMASGLCGYHMLYRTPGIYDCGDFGFHGSCSQGYVKA